MFYFIPYSWSLRSVVFIENQEYMCVSEQDKETRDKSVHCRNCYPVYSSNLKVWFCQCIFQFTYYIEKEFSAWPKEAAKSLGMQMFE